MDNKVKIPCGGFYLGDGLTMDGNTLNSSGGGKQVQTDWNQNDTTAKDYIKNRPGGYTKSTPGYEITWDGVVGDKVVVDAGGAQFVKVSDRVFTVEELIGATMIFGNQSFTINNDDIKSQNGAMLVYNYALVCTTPTTIVGVTIPESGTYFAKTEEAFVSSLSKPDSTTTIKIPAEYLELTETNEAISAAMSAASSAKATAETAQTTADTAKATADEALERVVEPYTRNVQMAPLYKNGGFSAWRNVVQNISYNKTEGYFFVNTFDTTALKQEDMPNEVFCVDVDVKNRSATAFLSCSTTTGNNWYVYGFAVITYGYSQTGEILYVRSNNIPQYSAKGLFLTFRAPDSMLLKSSTANSDKQFRITVDDSGKISATEVTA